MVAAGGIKVTRVEKSRLPQIDFNNLPFGKIFTDHMLEATYEHGTWSVAEIKPYQPIMIDPSMAAIHYGQSIFEGIKAYRNEKGEVTIFRPKDNFQRFNISAKRMEMPDITEEIFMEGMRALVRLDQDWIPQKHEFSLYIRPFMFATDPALGVKPSDTYKFMIILSPSGPYYSAPVKIYVEEFFTRACPGGVGFAKAAGNYAAALLASTEAKEKGYDQVLWTDVHEHKYVQEMGTMNVFFIISDTVYTPELSQGTILAGVTRDTAITLLKEMGLKVVEGPISMDILVDSYKKGILQEAFGTGTAATISMMQELAYRDLIMKFDVQSWKYAPEMKKRLDAIKYGQVKDSHGWVFHV